MTKIKKLFSTDSWEYQTASIFLMARSQDSNSLKILLRKKSPEEIIQKWCDTLDKLERLDKLTREEIRLAIWNALRDSFWKWQFHTLDKLRKTDKEGIMYVSKFLDLNNSDINNNKWITETIDWLE